MLKSSKMTRKSEFKIRNGLQCMDKKILDEEQLSE